MFKKRYSPVNLDIKGKDRLLDLKFKKEIQIFGRWFFLYYTSTNEG